MADLRLIGRAKPLLPKLERTDRGAYQRDPRQSVLNLPLTRPSFNKPRDGNDLPRLFDRYVLGRIRTNLIQRQASSELRFVERRQRWPYCHERLAERGQKRRRVGDVDV